MVYEPLLQQVLLHEATWHNQDADFSFWGVSAAAVPVVQKSTDIVKRQRHWESQKNEQSYI